MSPRACAVSVSLVLSNTMNRDEHLMRTRTILKSDEICLLAKSRFLPVFPLLATGTVCCRKQVPFQSLGKWNTQDGRQQQMPKLRYWHYPRENHGTMSSWNRGLFTIDLLQPVKRVWDSLVLIWGCRSLDKERSVWSGELTCFIVHSYLSRIIWSSRVSESLCCFSLIGSIKHDE